MPKQTRIIGDRVLRNYEFLNKLARTRSKDVARELIDKATSDQLLAIVEICSHVLTDFVLTSKQKKKLIPYAPFVRKLRRVRSEKGAKRVIQQGSGLVSRSQTGGFGFLPSLLIPVLVEAASSLLSK